MEAQAAKMPSAAVSATEVRISLLCVPASRRSNHCQLSAAKVSIGIDLPAQKSSTEAGRAQRFGLKQRLLRVGLGVVIGLGLLAVGGVVLIHTLGEHETLFEGKPAYRWIAQLQSKDPSQSNIANAVLNRTLIPHLTRAMVQDTNDSRLRVALVDYLNTLPNVNIFYRPAPSRRAEAAELLGEFGPAGRAAAPALLHALQGKDLAVRAAAATALGKMQADPAAEIPLLINYLDDKEINEAAALALADYGPPAKAAVPKLLQLSKVPDKDLHRAVMEALSKIDPTTTN